MARSIGLVGRASELSLLAGVLQTSLAGEAQVVVLRGEAGMGKSRLVRELVSRALPEVLVAYGHSMPLTGEALPYGVAADLLRSLVREAGEKLVQDTVGESGVKVLRPLVPRLDLSEVGQPVDRFALYATTQDLLLDLAAQRPLLLVVEDAHWADESSLDLLAFWARTVVRGRVAFGVTTRLPGPESMGDAEHVAGIGRLPNAIVVDLRGLSEVEIAEQVLALDPSASDELVADVQRLSGGNPLFVEELVSHGVEATSRSSILDLSAGLKSLPSELVGVLQLAALEERPVSIDALVHVTSTSAGEVADALDEAAARVLVERGGDGRWRFHHELLRRSTAASLRPSQQVAGHRAWASYFEALPEPRLGDLLAAAGHWVTAGAERQAFHAQLAAARASSKVAPSAETNRLWRRALDILHQAPGTASTEQHCEVLGRTALILTGWDEYVELIEREESALTPSEGLLSRFLLTSRILISTHFDVDDVDMAPSRADLTDLGQELEGDAHGPLLYAAVYQLAWVMEDLGYLEEADQMTTRLVALESSLPADVTAGMNLGIESLLASLRRREDAPRRVEIARDAMDDTRNADWASRSWAHATYARELIFSGRLSEGLTHARRSMGLVPGEEAERHWYPGALLASWSLRLLGEWESGLELADRCAHSNAYLFHALLVSVHRNEKLPTETTNSDTSTVELDRESPTNETHFLHSFTAATLAVRRQDKKAAALLAAAIPTDSIPHFTTAEFLTLMADMTCRLSSTEPTLMRAIQGAAEKYLWRGSLDDAWHRTIRAHGQSLRGDDSAATWKSAVETWDNLSVPFEAARCRLRWAEKLLADDLPDAAAQELGTALKVFIAVGATPLEREVHALAGRARLVIPGHSPNLSNHRGGLTNREWEVLQLLAAGQTNAQIGTSLYMSPRTASVHVSHILAKLGATNRTEVSAIAHMRGMIDTSEA